MSKNKSELVRQIEAYGLKGKLADLARNGRIRHADHSNTCPSSSPRAS